MLNTLLLAAPPDPRPRRDRRRVALHLDPRHHLLERRRRLRRPLRRDERPHRLPKDRAFKEDTYIDTSMRRGWTSEAFNTIEGRFAVDGDHMKIVALKGRQHGEDTLLSAGRYDRPMPEDVLRRQCKTYKFAVRSEEGKRFFVFFLGRNEDSEMKYGLIER